MMSLTILRFFVILPFFYFFPFVRFVCSSLIDAMTLSYVDRCCTLRIDRSEPAPLVPHMENKRFDSFDSVPSHCNCRHSMSERGDVFKALLDDSELFEGFFTKR